MRDLENVHGAQRARASTEGTAETELGQAERHSRRNMRRHDHMSLVSHSWGAAAET